MATQLDPLSNPVNPNRWEAAWQPGNLKPRSQPSPVRWKQISWHAWVGGVLFSVVVLAAVLAPLLAPYPPDQLLPGARLLPPGPAHLFGGDAFGRDLFSRVLFGAQIALRMSFLAVMLSAVPGIFLGLLAGYYRGWIDQVLSRLMDAWLALPGMLFAILIIACTGPSLDGAILALGLAGIPSYYRLTRATALSLVQAHYIEASRAMGAGGPWIIIRHILPNMLTSLVVLTSLRMGTMLLAGSGLSFVGLGAQPPDPEWGALLAEGREYLDVAPWVVFFPGAAITLTVCALNLLGDGIRDHVARIR